MIADLLIARDKKELAQFILDLCGFTLDEAGFNSEIYAFYLHVAFRHQALLQKEEWDALCLLSQDADNPLDWREENHELHERLAQFAQSIVTEVAEAGQDNWAVKLIKTSYLNHLDRVRKTSEQALAAIDQKIEFFDLSTQNPVEVERVDAPTKQLKEALEAHISYTDSLLTLPFVMEKFCLGIVNNKLGANYQPRKAAEMLAATLDTINASLSIENENTRHTKLIKGLQLALAISMPDVQFADHQLVDLIHKELLPAINKIIENSKQLEAKKTILFPKNADHTDTEIAKARKTMFATMGIRFESVQDILQETLMEPVSQCGQAVCGMAGMASVASKMFQTHNLVDNLAHISEIFANFDKIATISSQLDPALLPPWLKQANDYYQFMKGGHATLGAVAETARDGLGVFYHYTVSFIPQIVRNYFASTDALTKVLNAINRDPNEFQIDKVMAYFSFYELANRGNITDPLKAKFFSSYMDQVVKGDKKLKREEFSYAAYLLLEKQLNEKVVLDKTLAERINGFNTNPPLTRSFEEAMDKAIQMQDPGKLDILALIHRLQGLEMGFDTQAPEPIFTELYQAALAIQESKEQVHQIFHNEFLQPAVQRLFSQYCQEKLVPLLEAMLESHHPSLMSESHKLRLIYGKIKENSQLSIKDLEQFSQAYLKFATLNHDQTIAFKKELESLQGLLALWLPRNNKVVPERNWSTPKELSKTNAKITLEASIPLINQLLSQLQKQLDEQLDSCQTLAGLGANPELINLCTKKITYINELNGLINQFRDGLNEPSSDLQRQIMKILNGEIIELTQEQLSQNISLASLPGQLIRLAWSVIPPGNNNNPLQLNESFIYNLFSYYFENVQLHAVIQAENAYKQALNNNPIPSLMKELNDPMAIGNIMPSQEKIMDAIVENLLEVGSTTAVAWGANYLKQAVTKVSRDQLIKILPYPFLADLALQALLSETVQTAISPIVNSLVNEYGGFFTEKAVEVREAAKQRLYPILGIEIQKQIALGAYAYVLKPETASPTERDSFAMYYLQYQEIKKNNNHFVPEKAIEFLFSELLVNKTAEDQAKIISNIEKECVRLDEMMPPRHFTPSTAIDEANNQLQFLIEHLDFADPSNDKLIKLSLINQLLVMTMDAAEQLTATHQIDKLQQQAIAKLSATLEKVKQLSQTQILPGAIEPGDKEGILESFIILEEEKSASSVELTPETMVEVLSSANKRGTKIQLNRLSSSLDQTLTLVQDEIIQHDAMLETKEPLLGISLAEWEYRKSFSARRLTQVFSIIGEVAGLAAAWFFILAPLLAGAGVLQALLVAVGVAGAIGTTATLIGAMIVIAIALSRFAYKLIGEFWNNRATFKEINNNRSGLRFLSGITMQVVKCIGLATVKTIFSDYLVARVTTLLAFGPIIRLRNALRFWPTREQVTKEKEVLLQLQVELEQLKNLMKQPLDFDNKAKSPYSTETMTDRVEKLEGAMKKAETCFQTISFNDARVTERGLLSVMNAMQTQFENLRQEVGDLQQLQTSQASLISEEVKDEPAVAQTSEQRVEVSLAKPIVVDFSAYKQKALKPFQKSESQGIEKPTYLSHFWNLFSRTPAPTSSSAPLSAEPVVHQSGPLEKISSEPKASGSLWSFWWNQTPAPTPSAKLPAENMNASINLSSFVFLDDSTIDDLLSSTVLQTEGEGTKEADKQLPLGSSVSPSNISFFNNKSKVSDTQPAPKIGNKGP